MKTCPYCGKQYPDDATACAVDGEPLTVSNPVREKLTGLWRGAYGYERKDSPGGKIIPFTLKLKQGWLGHFSGTVAEDAPLGTPGVGNIDGYLKWPSVEFTKQMPVGYIAEPDGRRVTLREYFIERGHDCPDELPAAPISYQGSFLDANRAQGIWLIQPRVVSAPGGWGITTGQSTGSWCAEFIGTDLKATPTTAPTQPFFDRSRLPQPPILSGRNPSFRCLGKFRFVDAERLVKRFNEENIQFEMNHDDSSLRLMDPFTASLGGYFGGAAQIEIFVHPADEPKARAIINEGSQV